MQLLKMYGPEHPKFQAGISTAYQILEQILLKRQELAIAVIGNELASGEDIFFDLSKKLSDFINLLAGRGIEKVSFKEGVEKNEFKDFFLFFFQVGKKEFSWEHYSQSKGIKNIEAGKIRMPSSEKQNKEGAPVSRDLLQKVYSKSASLLSSSLAGLVKGEAINFADFNKVVAGLMRGVGYHYLEFLKLARLKEKDVITFSHALNVSFLAFTFSRNLGFSDFLCRKIAFAALFHDIGKLYVSDKLLKGKRLNQAEKEKIQKHSFLGAGLLLQHRQQLGELAPVVAFEHHLRFDLTGYPKFKFSRRLHLASMLVSLCDVYDAMSQRRSYKESYAPDKIYESMEAEKGGQFDAGLFDAFFRFMGVWPNGVTVLLSDGRKAKVENQNQDDIWLPKVKIFSEDNPEVINLKKDKTFLKIEKAIDF